MLEPKGRKKIPFGRLAPQSALLEFQVVFLYRKRSRVSFFFSDWHITKSTYQVMAHQNQPCLFSPSLCSASSWGTIAVQEDSKHRLLREALRKKGQVDRVSGKLQLFWEMKMKKRRTVLQCVLEERLTDKIMKALLVKLFGASLATTDGIIQKERRFFPIRLYPILRVHGS